MRSPGFPLATPFQGTLKYSGAYVRPAGCLVDNCAIGAECGSASLPSKTNQSDVRPTIFKSGPGWGSLRGRAGSRLGARPLIYTSTKIFEKIFHMIIFFNKVLDN